MPPASEPQRLPRPPSTITSNAIKSRVGPEAGSKLVQTDMKPAAMPTVTKEIPIAIA
jgi:hypothetical protein